MKIGNVLYFDHQATTPVGDHVLAEMALYQSESFGNPHSSDHRLGWESAQAVESAAARIAALIGVDADEIIFTSGATESNNLALLGLARRAVGNKRRRVLVSAIEHKCVLAAGRALEEQLGLSVEQIPVNGEGFVEVSAVEAVLDEDVLTISIMAVNNEIGTVQNIRAISKIARSHGCIFHCDAAQAPVAMDMNFLGDCVDLLSLSGHKMYGPKGIGAAYVSRKLHDRIEPLIYGGGQQNGLRSGTLPTPLCVGMGKAADLLTGKRAEERREQLRIRRDRFVEMVLGLVWPIALNGRTGQARHPGNANLRFTGFSAHDILGALQPHVAASTGSACTSGIPEPSHVLHAMGQTGDDAEASIRFSLGFDTTDEDIEEAVVQIERVLKRLSDASLVRST
ncbi:MAG: cysteine desulfurase family protein [Boseongicola sp.]|nr:cysteine desulfurase family protein [Boseongicola sp.]